jgi:hypothetical protein
LPVSFSLRVLPAKRHVPRVGPRGFEPLTSAVQRRHDALLELSGVCKIAANTHIFCAMPFPSVREIYSGCCTVAAHIVLARSRPVRIYDPLATASIKVALAPGL